VFFGPGGSGKTTIAKANAKNATIINDDRVLIRKLGNKFFAYGNPFYVQNFSAGNFGAEINRVYALKKNSRNYLKKMEKANAVAKLFSSATFANRNNSAVGKNLQLCYELIEKYGCYEFNFVKETPFLEAVKC